MTDNKNPIVISCGIVKKEIQSLIESGRLKADVTFLSSKLHYDYSLLEKALRSTIEKSLDRGRKDRRRGPGHRVRVDGDHRQGVSRINDGCHVPERSDNGGNENE